ncbi:hypothetical protein RchiOBHm_Chr6g0291761 [Rosa chinensis]|uniref:Uncharacterized protein n=1 Tax=Rosa chinensis TaxID=74649 RepID=A0A2P6PW88_ROSCH|nr:hypothetical protein RchiOBHm_Chr6g0291761 [Rosa chinensis]
MEVTFLNKLKAQKVALGEDVGTLDRTQTLADQKQWRDENKDLYMPLNQETENNEGQILKIRSQGTKLIIFKSKVLAHYEPYTLKHCFWRSRKQLPWLVQKKYVRNYYVT